MKVAFNEATFIFLHEKRERRENKPAEIFLRVKNGSKLQPIYVRIDRLPSNITTLLNGYARVKTGWHLDLCCLSAC